MNPNVREISNDKICSNQYQLCRYVLSKHAVSEECLFIDQKAGFHKLAPEPSIGEIPLLLHIWIAALCKAYGLMEIMVASG